MNARPACGLAFALALIATSSATAQNLSQPAPKLPDGRFQGVSANSKGVHFILLDQSSKTDGVVDLWRFTVNDPPIGASTQSLTHERIDCAKRTDRQIYSVGYDAADRPVIDLPPFPAEPIEANSAQDFMARVMCDGVVLPPQSIVNGRSAALKMAHDFLAPKR